MNDFERSLHRILETMFFMKSVRASCSRKPLGTVDTLLQYTVRYGMLYTELRCCDFKLFFEIYRHIWALMTQMTIAFQSLQSFLG